jgi:hypothetical protein
MVSPVPMTKVRDPKSYVAACGYPAFMALGALLIFSCRCGPSYRGQRTTPLSLGTNAVLYDAQDVDLIGSLGSPGKVSARVTYYWNDIEPTDGTWQFGVYDALVKRATDANIPLLGILAYSMKRVSAAAATMQGDPWAISFCPPDNNEDFATFAGTLAARYPQVRYWEIWNEPNISYFWRPSPDPARYFELLKVSYAAVKAANPNAVVLLGGLTTGIADGPVSAASFLQSVYQNGGKNYFDAVGLHPYHSASPDSYLADYVDRVHDVMARYDDGNKMVWVTEIGWAAGPGGDVPTEAEQADYLSRAFTILNGLNFVDSVYWYNLKEYSNPATPVTPSPAVGCGPAVMNGLEHGLFRYDGSRRPAADAFKKAAQ